MATTAQFSSPPWSLRKGSGRVQRRLSATRNTVGQDGAPLLSTLHAAELGLVVGFVRVEDALALALVSRATRDLVYARFPRPPPLDSGWGFALPCAARAPRLSTPTAAALDSIARLRWAARCGCHLSEAMAEQCAARSADPRLLDELRTRGVVLSARTKGRVGAFGDLGLSAVEHANPSLNASRATARAPANRFGGFDSVARLRRGASDGDGEGASGSGGAAKRAAAVVARLMSLVATVRGALATGAARGGTARTAEPAEVAVSGSVARGVRV
ncbi:hypothetical protein KFE25_008702 [Diacronema lutheri]|uniref:Uncharacterized protein n=1 Tax=Diacronema lutheri TaxID=2081491 RepID=A0A8J5XWE9_DIALT|nr:hypothetical protein KFE25_008702 [Diacronema lutheri]